MLKSAELKPVKLANVNSGYELNVWPLVLRLTTMELAVAAEVQGTRSGNQVRLSGVEIVGEAAAAKGQAVECQRAEVGGSAGRQRRPRHEAGTAVRQAHPRRNRREKSRSAC